MSVIVLAILRLWRVSSSLNPANLFIKADEGETNDLDRCVQCVFFYSLVACQWSFLFFMHTYLASCFTTFSLFSNIENLDFFCLPLKKGMSRSATSDNITVYYLCFLHLVLNL